MWAKLNTPDPVVCLEFEKAYRATGSIEPRFLTENRCGAPKKTLFTITSLWNTSSSITSSVKDYACYTGAREGLSWRCRFDEMTAIHVTLEWDSASPKVAS